MKYIFYLIILIYFLIFLEVFIYFKKYRIIPIIYIFISFIFFLRIDFSNQFFLNFNLFILTVIIFDVFSYVIGKSYGKVQLIKISPNKTYEGFLGGFLFSYLVSLLFSYFYNIAINLELIFFIFFIILSAFIGDIIESYYKRKNNLKNSSEFIPGHGGVFDRFDSFLFAIIIYSISINF
tara:strand:- start:1268 stop:1804 length:537 start_codon:yes stop_codon:yes gene_type:complete